VKLATNQPLEATGLLSLPASLVKVGLSNCASFACLLCTVLLNTNLAVLLWSAGIAQFAIALVAVQ